MAPSNSSSRSVAQRKAAKTADALTNAELTGKHRRRRDTLDSDSDSDPDFAPGGIVSDEEEGEDDLYDDDGPEEGAGEEGAGEEADGEEADGEEADGEEGAGEEGAGEESDGEESDGADEPSVVVVLSAVLKELKASRKVQAETVKVLKGLAPANASTANHPANLARKAKRDARRNDPVAHGPDSLPLDGTIHHFKGWRSGVVKAIFPPYFKAIGARWVAMPFPSAAPLAMTACGLDCNDSQQRADFEFYFKPELSRVGSKVKQLMGECWFDQLLVLFQLPPIKDAALASPPHLVAHKVAFKNMRSPPTGFDEADARYKYAAQWMTSLDANNQLMVFETQQCRKLLEVDFFARCVSKGLLSLSARKWNLGSLAWFLVYTHARLSIVRRPNGEGYGSLRDDGVISEIERVCEWLMDPISCPTTWPVLLKIRSENNNYGVTSTPVVA